MRGTSTQQSRTIQAVNITLDIMEKLREWNGAGVTELAEDLDHSKSTIHSHLRTLEERQFVVSEDDTYRLSARILAIAKQFRDQFGSYEVIDKQIAELADETGEIANFGARELHYVTYLYKDRGGRAVESATSVGTQQPIYSTALGKSILAHLPRAKQEEIIQNIDFEPRTANTITSREELYEELKQTEERGYAIDDEENVKGLRCVAAPVQNKEGVQAAVSLAGPSSRFTQKRLQGQLSDSVERTANVIELNTKFS